MLSTLSTFQFPFLEFLFSYITEHDVKFISKGLKVADI